MNDPIYDTRFKPMGLKINRSKMYDISRLAEDDSRYKFLEKFLQDLTINELYIVNKICAEFRCAKMGLK